MTTRAKLNRDEATQLVQRWLQTLYGNRMQVFVTQTQTLDWGWLFYWGELPEQHLFGAAPVIATRTGEVWQTGTACPPSFYVALFERVYEKPSWISPWLKFRYQGYLQQVSPEQLAATPHKPKSEPEITQ